jgi:hypothetical protein
MFALQEYTDINKITIFSKIRTFSYLKVCHKRYKENTLILYIP